YWSVSPWSRPISVKTLAARFKREDLHSDHIFDAELAIEEEIAREAEIGPDPAPSTERVTQFTICFERGSEGYIVYRPEAEGGERLIPLGVGDSPDDVALAIAEEALKALNDLGGPQGDQ